jgi:phosphoribosylaminoimidazole-succinocarboxamide synthase
MSVPVIEGSSKQFFDRSEHTYLMVFKDSLHGASRFGNILGTGYLRQAFTYYFYRILEQKQILTHLTDDDMLVDGIIVKKLLPIKLEIILRNRARGHWVDEHKIPLLTAGEVISPPLVEFCLKWKKTLFNGQEVDDPRISSDLILLLDKKAKDLSIRHHLLRSLEEIEQLKQMALKINDTYSFLLEQVGWILEDFKFEVGVVEGDVSRQFILIDEISPDSSRIRDKEGNSLTKDLFRQKREDTIIYDSYLRLKDFMEHIYASSH